MEPVAKATYCLLYEILVSCIFDKLYPRANQPASLRPIVCFTLELERFVHDCTTRIENEKLLSCMGGAIDC